MRQPTNAGCPDDTDAPQPRRGLQTSVEITFVGGIKSVRFDYGDGTSVVHNRAEYGLSGWQCEAPITALKTSGDSGGRHAYAQAGTYRVTVTVTTVDCRDRLSPPGRFVALRARPPADHPWPCHLSATSG